jgi:hypothetical protein
VLIGHTIDYLGELSTSVEMDTGGKTEEEEGGGGQGNGDEMRMGRKCVCVWGGSDN